MSPNLEEHCKHSLKRYGKTFEELHKWMDELTQICGPTHRKFRHDIKKTPNEAKQIFGELADQACLDHILLDNYHSHRLGRRKAGITMKTVKLIVSRIPRSYENSISFSSLAKKTKLNYSTIKNCIELINFIQNKIPKITIIKLESGWQFVKYKEKRKVGV